MNRVGCVIVGLALLASVGVAAAISLLVSGGGSSQESRLSATPAPIELPTTQLPASSPVQGAVASPLPATFLATPAPPLATPTPPALGAVRVQALRWEGGAGTDKPMAAGPVPRDSPTGVSLGILSAPNPT